MGGKKNLPIFFGFVQKINYLCKIQTKRQHNNIF